MLASARRGQGPASFWRRMWVWVWVWAGEGVRVRVRVCVFLTGSQGMSLVWKDKDGGGRGMVVVVVVVIVMVVGVGGVLVDGVISILYGLFFFTQHRGLILVAVLCWRKEGRGPMCMCVCVRGMSGVSVVVASFSSVFTAYIRYIFYCGNQMKISFGPCPPQRVRRDSHIIYFFGDSPLTTHQFLFLRIPSCISCPILPSHSLTHTHTTLHTDSHALCHHQISQQHCQENPPPPSPFSPPSPPPLLHPHHLSCSFLPSTHTLSNPAPKTCL